MNTKFGNSRNTYASLLNQDVSKFSSPTFRKVYCETPVVSCWDDLNVSPFSANIGPGVSPPSIVKFKDDGSGSTGSYVYAFEEKKEEELFFSVQLPHSYKETTDIKPHVHFCTPTQTATTITWGIEYNWTNINENFGPTAIISNDIACPAPYAHTIGPLGTISGAGKKISSILTCRLFRAIGGYVGKAYLLSVDFHIIKDTVGSLGEITK